MARQSSRNGGDHDDPCDGGGSTLCMKLCDATDTPLPEQINSLSKLVLKMKVTEPGELWYVVCSTFWENWREYARTMECRPPCIDNAALLGEDGVMRTDLQELKDYVLVDSRVWRIFVAMFGVAPGSELPRQVIRASEASTQLQIELFPFTFYVGKVDGDMLESSSSSILSQIWLSRSLTIHEAVSKICELLQIAPTREAYTWWRRGANAETFFKIEQWTQVGQGVRLDMLDIADRDEIIVQCSLTYTIDSSLSNNERYRTTRPLTDLRTGDLVDAKFGNSYREARVKKVDVADQKILISYLGCDENWDRTVKLSEVDSLLAPLHSRSTPSSIERKRARESSNSPRLDMVVHSEQVRDDESLDWSMDELSHGSTRKRKMIIGPEWDAHANELNITTFERNENLFEASCGIRGLSNLGNTCFMASTLQCLNQAPALTQYFLSRRFVKDINMRNPLGFGGHLANEYGALVRQLWSKQREPYSPFSIKRCVAQHAPMFSGFRQHDCQEFLAFFLDGLHEDLNLITNKPYTEAKDSDGRPDEVVATEAWERHLLRDRSIIVDLFQGQLKSTVVCPECDRVSVTFDPFMYLSLPLNPSGMCSRFVIFVPLDSSQAPVLHSLQMRKTDTIYDLRHRLGAQVNVAPDLLYMIEVWSHKPHRELDDFLHLSRLGASDLMYAYEIPIPRANKYITVSIVHQRAPVVNGVAPIYPRPSTSCPVRRFAYPRLLFIEYPPENPQSISLFELKHQIGLVLANMAGDATLDTNGVVLRSFVQQSVSCIVCKMFQCRADGGCIIAPLKNRYIAQPRLSLSVEWTDTMFEAYESKTGPDATIPSSSGARFDGGVGSRTGAISLLDCVEFFTKKEILSKDDPWYCSSCKAFQQASKQFAVYKSPEVLIVHLKRFEYVGTYRSKLNTLVDFPVEGLDLSNFVMRPPLVGGSCVYDLFAVSNHMGSAGGGHYTAYVKHAGSGQWYLCNDSSTHLVDASHVITPSAYVLYYKLRC